MACKYTPEHIRNDPELQKKFPPERLEGLDKSLCWGIQRRMFELTQQLARAEESWRNCGLDTKWMREIIQNESLRNFLDSQ